MNIIMSMAMIYDGNMLKMMNDICGDSIVTLLSILFQILAPVYCWRSYSCSRSSRQRRV